MEQRRSIRYAGYDYSQAGYYALTICTAKKAHLFGELGADASLQLSELGEAVKGELLALPARYANVRIDAWVLMPHHVHVIVVLTHHRSVHLGELVGGFKSRCYQHWRAIRQVAGQGRVASCWQRNYYERIIRNAVELEAQRAYILDNPQRWATAGG